MASAVLSRNATRSRDKGLEAAMPDACIIASVRPLDPRPASRLRIPAFRRGIGARRRRAEAAGTRIAQSAQKMGDRAMARTSSLAAESSDVQACIDLCVRCARTCLDKTANVCLEKSGRHARPSHIALMLGCADLCSTTARFLIMHAMLEHKLCFVCAEVCEACAVSCEQLQDMEDMEDCVEVCRACAVACRRLAVGTAGEA